MFVSLDLLRFRPVMKSIVALQENEPLAKQVATFLLKGKSDRILDLGDTQVLIPTAGAGRAICRELAKAGVLSPQFLLPMDFLLPPGIPVATRLERESAWSTLLIPSKRRAFTALIPEVVPLESPQDRYAVADRLCNVSDQLAEVVLDPTSTRLRTIFEDDAQRWDTFGALYLDYQSILSNHQLRDPNDVRLAQANSPDIAPGLSRIVVACIPDLPAIAQQCLESLFNKGIEICVLVWSPLGQASHLDPWGRPFDKTDATSSLSQWWKLNPPQVSNDSIVAANDPPTEAGVLLDFASKIASADYALYSAAPESGISLHQEIMGRDAIPHLPEGRPLAQTEPAGLLLGWSIFVRSRRLRDLRTLLQKPSFLSFYSSIGKKTDQFPHRSLLEACDRLIGERLCEHLETAESWLQHAKRPTQARSLREFTAQENLIQSARLLLERRLDGSSLLMAVTEHRGSIDANSMEAKELLAMAEILQQFQHSPLLCILDAEMREAAIQVEIARMRVFSRRCDKAIEIQGWLEAPWSTAKTLIIAGCREGALPSGTHDDSFLPDQAKAKLGVSTQKTRYLRDTYLLSCLLTSRSREHVRLGFSRVRNNGEPNRPSRLLFGCDDAELSRRSTLLFKPTPPAIRNKKPSQAFKLHIPKPEPGQWPVQSIRVTSFKSFLTCPVRFYLSHVLGLRKVDPDAREIPATDFGTLIHKVLEEFSSDRSLAALQDPQSIAREFGRLLEQVVPIYYGAIPSAVVRVQVENMRSRLSSAAYTESIIRADGWRTIATEYRVEKDDQCLLGGLALTGTMDRVDSHPEFGLRILDYKTFSQRKSPAMSHIGPSNTKVHLPEADLQISTKTGKIQQRSWIDLQLPLYDWMARQIWPEDAAKGVSVGYFLLPAETEMETNALEIFDLTDAMRSSALSCATRIASLVRHGQFWPPSSASEVEFDDFKDWFMDGPPETLLDEASVQLLKGPTGVS